MYIYELRNALFDNRQTRDTHAKSEDRINTANSSSIARHSYALALPSERPLVRFLRQSNTCLVAFAVATHRLLLPILTFRVDLTAPMKHLA